MRQQEPFFSFVGIALGLALLYALVSVPLGVPNPQAVLSLAFVLVFFACIAYALAD